MASENVNVRITGELKKHLQQQTGEGGLYENSSEYIRDLIRKDLKSKEDAWSWLKKELEPALYAEDESYKPVTASDVIGRNRKKSSK
jgi:antitoxin ParD1/3/4